MDQWDERAPALVAGMYNGRMLSARVATAGQPEEDELRAMEDAGCEAVINLGLADADYALPDERALVRSLGMHYSHIPVNFQRPLAADLDAFFRAMQEHRERRLLVHCAANKRVSVFMSLYRLRVAGEAPAEVLPDLHAIWQPDPVWQAFLDAGMRGELL